MSFVSPTVRPKTKANKIFLPRSILSSFQSNEKTLSKSNHSRLRLSSKAKVWSFLVNLMVMSIMLCLFVIVNLANQVDDYYNYDVIQHQQHATTGTLQLQLPSSKELPIHEDYYISTTSTSSDSIIDLPVIHIINTRFMQQQGHLKHLSWARLFLFETFCLPTIIHQTIQTQHKFIWIIKVDPLLDENVRKRLIQVLKPYPNFYLVGSNNNFGVGVKPGSWRSGESGTDILAAETPIYTGSLRLLEYAHQTRKRKIVIETRLDADDGLPLEYLENIQNFALAELSYINNSSKTKATTAKWMYWCISEVINWYPSVIAKGLLNSNPTAPVEDIKALHDPGSLYFFHDEQICYTPGLTFALAVGEVNYPKVNHYNLLYQRKRLNCGLGAYNKRDNKNKTTCVNQVPNMRAIRSRTPTSAGFKDLDTSTAGNALLRQDTDGDGNTIGDVNNWNLLNRTYGISSFNAYATNLYLQENLLSILKDNWKGQCTSGHSCKHQSKEELKAMIRQVGGDKALEEIIKKPLLRKHQK